MARLKVKQTVFAAMLASLIGCGSSSSKDDSETPTTTTTPTTGTGTGSSTALSSEFKAACSTCHGADGTSTAYEKIKGTTLTEAQFKSVVRSGKGSMPPVSSSSYSDANLSSDYAILKQ